VRVDLRGLGVALVKLTSTSRCGAWGEELIVLFEPPARFGLNVIPFWRPRQIGGGKPVLRRVGVKGLRALVLSSARIPFAARHFRFERFSRSNLRRCAAEVAARRQRALAGGTVRAWSWTPTG
jgi:hypothetical protein